MSILGLVGLLLVAALFVALYFGLRANLRFKSERHQPAIITATFFLLTVGCVAGRVAIGDTGEDSGPPAAPHCSGARYCE